MGKHWPWLAVAPTIAILAACTCGVRTECPSRAEISVLVSVHDDPGCQKLSTRGVLLDEAAKFFAETHNNKTSGLKIELAVMDTCGSIAGTVKAAMKALVSADLDCLQPPHYLGIIGPESSTNAEAVHKISSVLSIPQIVEKASSAPYMHHLVKESDGFVAQSVLQVAEALKWKSFTLVADGDEDNEDDVQNIAKKLTSSAIEKGLCVMVHDDSSDEQDFTSHVVHIGKPDNDFFLRGPTNATIIVASEGRIQDYLNRRIANTSNTILLLEDSRNDFVGLEARVAKSRWWSQNDDNSDKYDAEELRDVRWLEDAIEVYAKALDTLCKKKRCKNQVNPTDWNNVVSNIVTVRNAETRSAIGTMNLGIRRKNGAMFEQLARVTVKKNHAKIYWKKQSSSSGSDDEDEDGDDDDDDNDVPPSFLQILSKEKEKRSGCATTAKEIKMMHEEDDEEAARVLLTEIDDSEWWTMVGTVSGVGVAMFVVGILAVYVVYSNIRGPRTPKSKGRGLERDTSLRRVGSDREIPAGTRSQRPGGRLQGPQRRDSNRSIRSNMSDKSV